MGNRRRRLDFLVGVPIIFVLGFVRRLLRGKRNVPTAIKEIGLLQTVAIGDTVIMSAVWRDLRRQFPSARLRVLAGESNYDISQLLFGAENVQLLPVEDPWQSLLLAARMHFDVLIDFGPWPRWNVVLAMVMPALYRIGYATEGQYRHYAYDCAVVHSPDVHEMENQRALIAVLGIKPEKTPGFPPEALAHDGGDPAMARTVILHAWSGGFKGFHKLWPTGHWVELGRRLAQAGFAIELSGSQDDRAKSENLKEAMSQAGVSVTNDAGNISFADLIKKIAAAHAVISVDTGIAHVAAAAGAFTIGLHGPSPARRWRAIGPRAVAIESPCAGCGFLDLGFEYPPVVPPCMEAITVDRVWAEFLKHPKASP